LKGGNPTNPDLQFQIPMYNPDTKKPTMPHPSTDPFRTNAQNTYYNEQQDQKKQTQPQTQTQTQNITGQQMPNQGIPIINLQMYQPPKPPQPKIPDNQNMAFYNNNIATLTDPLAFAQYQQMLKGIIPMIHKEYNFNINGISGSHANVAKLYENILPVKNSMNVFNSLDERITLYEGIRSTLFPQGDGSNTAIDGGSIKTTYTPTHELLSHIKLLDMNPYSIKRFTNNPYDELPAGFLLYRSCYPIKHDSQKASSVCAANSTGVNVRVYKLCEGSYLMKVQNGDNKKYFDEWRDIAYYEYIRDEILKKKICPNFVMLYGYTITLHSGIDFNTQNLKNKQHPINHTMAQQQAQHYARQLLQSRNMNYQRYGLQPTQTQIQKPKSIQEQLNEYTGKVICALTEAPNYNMIGWARKEYRAVGNINTMISSGYYSNSVWYSVLFQLYVAIYVMQKYEIYFEDFSFEKHVFIKDVQTTTNYYWIYKINNIDYYIPNHGYVVLIDTNFRDWDKDKSIEGKEYDTSRPRKIMSKIFDVQINNAAATPAPGTGTVAAAFTTLGAATATTPTGFGAATTAGIGLGTAGIGAISTPFSPATTATATATGIAPPAIPSTPIDYKKEIFEKVFKIATDLTPFMSQDFTNSGGVKPPQTILDFVNKIKQEVDTDTTYEVLPYFVKYFTMFLHNRVGTLLNEKETPLVNMDATKKFNKGSLVPCNDGNPDVFRFVIYIEPDSTDPNQSKILTKDIAGNIYDKIVLNDSLGMYSIIDPIQQNGGINNMNFSQENLQATYIIN